MAREEVNKLWEAQKAAVEKYRTEKNLARLCYRLMKCDAEYREACGCLPMAYRVKDVMGLVIDSGVCRELQMERHEVATRETVRAALDTIERAGYHPRWRVNDSATWGHWSGRRGARQFHETGRVEYRAREYRLAK